MTDELCTRRTVVKGTLGLTCSTCAIAGEAGASRSTAALASQGGGNWDVLDVSGHPFSIRYRSGYESDAERVREWAVFAYESVQDAYAHELDTPITFDLFPRDEYSQPAGNMMYNENTHSVSLLTPSEYDGGYDDEEMFYRHGVTHEYVHAVQKDAMSFHTHAGWLMEGFAEAIAVYRTDDEIYEAYHTEHERANETRRDVQRGYGYLLGVNEYVYRGSMQLLNCMFQKYGTQAVGEIFEQDARNVVEAMEMRLGITPLDLEAEWLAYAQREIGGDYTEQIERLGGTVSAAVSVDTDRAFEPGQLTVRKAVARDDPYRVVVFDDSMTAIGMSDAFDAEERAEGVRIPLRRELDEPHRVTVRLHHSTGSGFGDPIEVDGSDVAETFMYATSTAAVRFASPPAPEDASVSVSASVAGSYEPDGNIALAVMNGDSTNLGDRIDESHQKVVPGSEVHGREISLDETAPAVPLSDGQTVTAVLMDLAGNDPIARATVTVGSADGTASQRDTLQQGTDDETARATSTTVDSATAASVDGDAGTTASSGGDAPDSPQSTSTTGAAGPGFGIVSGLAGIGGVVRRLRRRTDDQ